MFIGALPARGFELLDHRNFKAEASLNTRLGLRQGFNINLGVGALQGFGKLGSTTGETTRTDLELALRPTLAAKYTLDQSEVYGGVTVVAATTTLDGELSGQFARAGERVLNTDSAFVGWRHKIFDFSYGAQPFPWVMAWWSAMAISIRAMTTASIGLARLKPGAIRPCLK